MHGVCPPHHNFLGLTALIKSVDAYELQCTSEHNFLLLPNTSSSLGLNILNVYKKIGVRLPMHYESIMPLVTNKGDSVAIYV